MKKLIFSQKNYAIYRLSPAQYASLDSKSIRSEFLSISLGFEEVTVIAEESAIFVSEQCESGWHMFHLEGPISFTEVGVLQPVLSLLKEAGSSVFVISTYRTDYVFYKISEQEKILDMLQAGGFLIEHLVG